MFTIGITGGSGAGKTSALRALNSLGALTLDCDAIYHELLESDADLISDLVERFGDVLSNGAIDRKLLGNIVFNDSAALLDLNTITHRYIGKALAQRIEEWESQGGEIVAIDAIALIESGRAKTCDVVIGVTAPRETRISRIMARDSITREQAEMRINAQKPDSFFKENCDYLLEAIYKKPGEFEAYCVEFFSEILRKNKKN